MAPALRSRPVHLRNALSNGSRLHVRHVDGRTEEGRRFADLVADLTAERAGAAALPITQQQAIRRYAQLVVELETLEAIRASGKPIDVEAYGQLCDRLDRQSRRLGPVRANKPVSAREYAASRGGAPCSA
ncbi:MAG: hypothetical protein K2X71_06265 [Methylobacterium sp.]|uniref:hypothetical protein n=1 Tax=Methylobacterium sp. TaxID=409 RepID=UPI00258A93F3|nr:hypothetical protein [Methylobacterium sp.]MBY0295629.1 hypothetical protein [Methylobacterium sp.]